MADRDVDCLNEEEMGDAEHVIVVVRDVKVTPFDVEMLTHFDVEKAL